LESEDQIVQLQDTEHPSRRFIRTARCAGLAHSGSAVALRVQPGRVEVLDYPFQVRSSDGALEKSNMTGVSPCLCDRISGQSVPRDAGVTDPSGGFGMLQTPGQGCTPEHSRHAARVVSSSRCSRASRWSSRTRPTPVKSHLTAPPAVGAQSPARSTMQSSPC